MLWILMTNFDHNLYRSKWWHFYILLFNNTSFICYLFIYQLHNHSLDYERQNNASVYTTCLLQSVSGEVGRIISAQLLLHAATAVPSYATKRYAQQVCQPVDSTAFTVICNTIRRVTLKYTWLIYTIRYLSRRNHVFSNL